VGQRLRRAAAASSRKDGLLPVMTTPPTVTAAGGGVLDFRRTRPAAVRERAAADDAAAMSWPAEGVRELAAEKGLDPADSSNRVALVATLRRAEPRLSLLRATQLVDDASGRR
jgi:hypothetical protein